MASFKCKDMDMKCNFEVKSDNVDEMMPMIALHAEKTHQMKTPFPQDMMLKVQKAIKR